MSQPPTPYARIFDFEAFSTNNPATQQPGVQFEGEFDAIKLTVDSLMSRLAEIQRDDGQLRSSAFDNTDIIENIQDTSYAAVYSLLFPLVGQAAAHSDAASASASASQNSATQAAAYLAQALQHKSDAAASAALSASQALQAQQALGAVNVAAGSAQSAAYAAEQSKLATLVASNAASESLGSVQQLQQTLANKYDNMLDGDQNLADVSNKSHSVTNLGLNPENPSHRSIYNRFCSMFSMYVDPNSEDLVGYQPYLGIDQYLAGMFNLKFNSQTGLFEKNSNYGGTYFGIQTSNGWGQSPPDSTIGNKTVEHLVNVLKIRMSLVSSILRTTMHVTDRRWGYNGDNRIITMQELRNNPGGEFDSWAWGLVQTPVLNVVNDRFINFEAPQNDKQYARRNAMWVEVAGGSLSEYDNYKIYSVNDVVWLGSFIYRFNANIGAAGYGPVTHPYAWTKLSASEIADINGLQTALDGKALSTHTHAIASVTGLQAALNAKANTTHTHATSQVTGLDSTLNALQVQLNGKASSTHSHEISSINSLGAYLASKQNIQMGVAYFYDQSTQATAGILNILGYNGGTDGVVYCTGPVGSRYFFYQSANAASPIAFYNAVQNQNKLFTNGPKSWVEAVVTYEGVVLNGDLSFPPSGYLISSSCDSAYATDAQGQSWEGNFYSNMTYADGSGGTYQGGGYNQNGCWYPYGFCIEAGVTTSSDSFWWDACGSSGTYTYSSSNANLRADGNGGTFYADYTGWSAYYGDVIYDNGSCVVKYDGMGSYFTESTGGGTPPYGSYLGQVSGYSYLAYGSNLGEIQNGTYTADSYADGNGGTAYYENYSYSYYSYGIYLGYDTSYGYGVFSDGNGSYYTSCPPANVYLYQGSGDVTIYYTPTGGDYIVGTMTYDTYADGYCGTYGGNYNYSYYSYGTYLFYDGSNGWYVYSDGNGSYYTSY